MTTVNLSNDQLEDVVLNLLETLVDRNGAAPVDLGGLFDDETAARDLSLIVDRNSGEWLDVTLWDDESQPDPMELAVLRIRVERVI